LIPRRRPFFRFVSRLVFARVVNPLAIRAHWGWTAFDDRADINPLKRPAGRFNVSLQMAVYVSFQAHPAVKLGAL
jgi:hypothetical protein